VAEKFFISELPNGMTLLGQHMEQVSSAAMALLVSAGASYDPVGGEGTAAVAGEWCFRGAGPWDTRGLNDALDSLGCRHHESIRSEHILFSAAQLGRNLPDVLAIYADVIRRPRLDDETFGPCRDLTLQDLASLEDEPAKKCNTLLREKFYPWPLGRCVFGNFESLQVLKAETVREHVGKRFCPGEAILAVAGNINWDQLHQLVQKHFGDWSARSETSRRISPRHGGVTYIRKDSAQTHIALAHESVTIDSPYYYAARVAETVLSGGMASRLFTEVREKRGLVYHVSTHYHSLRDYAGMFTYAGTTPQKAQETLDVTVGELRRLAEGIEPQEMDRARTQLKSGLIMQCESTEARASSLADDWHHLRRLRSLRELSDAIDAVTTDEVMDYLSQCPAKRFTVLVIGPEPLDTSEIGE